MPSGRFENRPACSSTWPATRIAWPSPIVGLSATTPAASPSGTRTMPTAAAMRTMTLSGSEFIRRFLLHVLPKGFMRIRYFGYLANRQRQEKLALCRRLLGEAVPPPVPDSSPEPSAPHAANDEHAESVVCPACQQGALRIIFQWDRYSPAASHPPVPAARCREQPREDSS